MNCQNCQEEFEPGFDVCWNCGTDVNGAPAKEFIRPEDQPEDPEAFVKALNFIGLITWTFRFKKESKPWMSGDFLLPSWAVPLIIGVVLGIVAAILYNGLLAWVSIGLLACGWTMFLFRKLF